MITVSVFCAEGKPTGLFTGVENEILVARHRWARIADFLREPAALKAYMREHCSNEVIDTSNEYWSSGLWLGKWSEDAPPGPTNACINVTYAEEYSMCAPASCAPCNASISCDSSWLHAACSLLAA